MIKVQYIAKGRWMCKVDRHYYMLTDDNKEAKRDALKLLKVDEFDNWERFEPITFPIKTHKVGL